MSVERSRPYPGSSHASSKRSVEMVVGLFILWREVFDQVSGELGRSCVDGCEIVEHAKIDEIVVYETLMLSHCQVNTANRHTYAPKFAGS